jgi:hypothetical protein
LDNKKEEKMPETNDKKEPFGAPAEGDGANNKVFELPLDNSAVDQNGRITRGRYKGKLINIVDAPAKTSGNPMWTWTFVITEGEFAGREFKMYTVKTSSGAWKIQEVLIALGIDVKAGIRFAEKDVIGKAAVLLIDDDSYQGIDRSKLVGVKEPGFLG